MNMDTTAINQGRKWNFMSDASITAQKKSGRRTVDATDDYKTKMVSPICRWEDIEKVQELIRKLREAGAIANEIFEVLAGENHGAVLFTNTLHEVADIFHCQIGQEEIKFIDAGSGISSCEKLVAHERKHIKKKGVADTLTGRQQTFDTESNEAPIAESLRISVQSADIAGHHITVSIGVAYCGENRVKHYESVIARADEAVYAAKRAG